MKRKTYDDLKYSIRILNNGDRTYSVEVPALPGCYSSGKTKAECISNIVEAIELHIEDRKDIPPAEVLPAIEVVSESPKHSDWVISLPEACRFLDISDATIRRYIKSGKLPAYNFGKEYKFRIDELSRFIESTRVDHKLRRKGA